MSEVQTPEASEPVRFTWGGQTPTVAEIIRACKRMEEIVENMPPEVVVKYSAWLTPETGGFSLGPSVDDHWREINIYAVPVAWRMRLAVEGAREATEEELRRSAILSVNYGELQERIRKIKEDR